MALTIQERIIYSSQNSLLTAENERHECTSDEQEISQTEKCPPEEQSEECTTESTESLIEFADDLMNYINKKYETKCREIIRDNHKLKVY